MKTALTITFLGIYIFTTAQRPLRINRNPSDSTSNYYFLSIPNKEIKGLLSLDFQDIADSSINYANEKGLAIMVCYPTTKYPDLMLEEKPIALWAEMNNEVMKKYNIPYKNLVVAGMSLSGTAAVRYGEFITQNKMKGGLSGIVAVDSPLDYERFWKECDKKARLNFNEAAASEGKWVRDLLEKKLGGNPQKKLKAYQKASPYCYNALDGGNAIFLKNIPVRIIHEPDVNWWIENRRQDYTGMNSIDAAGLVNQLKILGNQNAELVETHNKGFRPDGSRHPHSWSIVNEKELIDWCLEKFK
jgi:hypothetical protein